MVSRCIGRIAVVGLVALSLVPWALAQQSGQKGSTGSRTSPSGNTGNTTNLPPTKQPNTPPGRPQRQTLFITGTVVQEDGTPPPFGAVIERMCNARIKREATVDPNGGFSFQVGGDYPTINDVMPDASDDSFGGGMGSFGNNRTMPSASSGMNTGPSFPNLMGCELRARLDGYRSSSVILQGFDNSGQIDVGTLVLSPMSRVSGTLVSASDLQAPKQAKKALERAHKALQKNQVGQAEKDLKSALEAYPKYAMAWFDLGRLYQQQQRVQDARAAFQQALAIDGNFVSPYIQLAELAGTERKWQEVAKLTDQALALDPLDFPKGYFYNSVAYYNLGNLDNAEKSAKKAARLDGLHRLPQVNLLMADILQKKQDVAGSIAQLQLYLKFAPNATNAGQIRTRIEELQKSSAALATKHPEQ